MLVSVSKIKNNPKNPRKIKKDAAFDKLKTSIQEFPEMLEKRPLVCVTEPDGKYMVLGGNQRLKALKELKIKEVNILLADDWTEEQRERFVIADNVSVGAWDELSLDSWQQQELIEWGEIEHFEKELELEDVIEDDYEVPDEIQTDIVLGDLFQIGEHRLLCGDSTCSDTVAKLMQGEKADMVFTDPPYGVSYTGGHNEKKRKGIENDTLQGRDLTNLFRDSLLNADLFSNDYSAFYIWFSTNKAQETFLSFSELNLEVRAILCWYKVKSGLGAFMAQYIPNFEPCIYAFKKGKSPQWFGASDEKSVWELKKDQRNDYHPTQKPIELPERAIKNSSKLSDIIYDCFLGSGSTMVAAHQLKRKCYGIELDPKYCQVIIERMRKLDPNLKITKNGLPYDE